MVHHLVHLHMFYPKSHNDLYWVLSCSYIDDITNLYVGNIYENDVFLYHPIHTNEDYIVRLITGTGANRKPARAARRGGGGVMEVYTLYSNYGGA